MKMRLQHQSQNYLKKKRMHKDALISGSPNRTAINQALQDAREQRNGAMDGLERVMHNREVYICILFATAVSVVISFRCHDSSSRALTSWLIKNCILNSTIRWYQCMRAVVIFLSPRG